MIKKNRNYQAGFSYVELIVVLSIFAVISSVIIFNYSGFETKIDLKNLASDIALQIVQAQKAALSGLLPTQSYGSSWKPSYGVYFDITKPAQFVYFVDLDDTNNYEGGSEILNTYSITKNNYISNLSVSGTGSCSTITDLTIIFQRPNSGATITSSTPLASCNISYVQITVTDQKKDTFSYIKLYPPGRVEVD